MINWLLGLWRALWPVLGHELVRAYIDGDRLAERRGYGWFRHWRCDDRFIRDTDMLHRCLVQVAPIDMLSRATWYAWRTPAWPLLWLWYYSQERVTWRLLGTLGKSLRWLFRHGLTDYVVQRCGLAQMLCVAYRSLRTLSLRPSTWERRLDERLALELGIRPDLVGQVRCLFRRGRTEVWIPVLRPLNPGHVMDALDYVPFPMDDVITLRLTP